MKKLPKQTSEFIAACAAHELYFWAKAPGPAMLWATGPDQSWHLVKIHRTTGKASHACTAWGEIAKHTGPCPGGTKPLPYAVPESFEAAAALFEPQPEGIAA